MNANAAQVRKLLHQQAAVAHFGSFALRETDVLKVLTEAARVCAECLSVPFSKVCRYRVEQNDLLIEAGHGWHVGVIRNVVSRADVTSPQGALSSPGSHRYATICAMTMISSSVVLCRARHHLDRRCRYQRQ